MPCEIAFVVRAEERIEKSCAGRICLKRGKRIEQEGFGRQEGCKKTRVGGYRSAIPMTAVGGKGAVVVAAAKRLIKRGRVIQCGVLIQRGGARESRRGVVRRIYLVPAGGRVRPGRPMQTGGLV